MFDKTILRMAKKAHYVSGVVHEKLGKFINRKTGQIEKLGPLELELIDARNAIFRDKYGNMWEEYRPDLYGKQEYNTEKTYYDEKGKVNHIEESCIYTLENGVRIKMQRLWGMTTNVESSYGSLQSITGKIYSNDKDSIYGVCQIMGYEVDENDLIKLTNNKPIERWTGDKAPSAGCWRDSEGCSQRVVNLCAYFVRWYRELDFGAAVRSAFLQNIKS
jgi:hypothetical protein